MSDTILFIFEGEKIEEEIFKSISANFFSSSNSKTVIRAFFSGEIFQLWNKVKDDDYLDIVEILKERPNSQIKERKRTSVGVRQTSSACGTGLIRIFWYFVNWNQQKGISDEQRIP